MDRACVKNLTENSASKSRLYKKLIPHLDPVSRIRVDVQENTRTDAQTQLNRSLSEHALKPQVELCLVTGHRKSLFSKKGAIRRLITSLSVLDDYRIESISQRYGVFYITQKKTCFDSQTVIEDFWGFYSDHSASQQALLLETLSQQVDQKNTNAMLQKAILMLQSNKSNEPSAFALIEESIRLGNGLAAVTRGFFSLRGIYVEKSNTAALHYFKLGEQLQEPYAYYYLAHCYHSGVGIDRNITKGDTYLEQAADLGVSAAQFQLGMRQDLMEKHSAKNAHAVANYRNAAQRGERRSLLKLGELYESGLHGFSCDHYLAFSYYYQVANASGTSSNLSGRAMNKLGHYMMSGRFDKSHPKKAFEWYIRGAKQQNHDCMAHVAEAYYSGRGTKQNIKHALQWANKAKEESVIAKYVLAHATISEQRDVNPNECMLYLQEAAALNYKPAQELISLLLDLIMMEKQEPSETYLNSLIDLHGRSVKEAEAIVKQNLLLSARQNIRRLRIVTGRGNHINNKGVRGTLYHQFPNWIKESNAENIKRWVQHDGFYEVFFKEHDAAETIITTETLYQRHTNAFQSLVESKSAQFLGFQGVLYENGLEIKQDFKLAFKYYQLAANRGNVFASHQLARCYLHGIGTRINDERANQWLQAAHEKGCASATVCLADSYLYGRGVPRNHKKGFELIEIAAKNDDAKAMRLLGTLFMSDIPEMGISKNMITSFEWYHKAAELNDPIACYNVAVFLLNGRGCEVDLRRSFEYAEKSAQYGDPDGACLLGEAYLMGRGVAPNVDLATKYFEQASAGGSQMAQLQLTQMKLQQPDLYLKKRAESGDILAAIQYDGVDLEKMNDNEFKQYFRDKTQQYRHLTVNDIILLDYRVRYFLIDNFLLTKNKKLKKKATDVLHRLSEQDDEYSLRRLFITNFHDQNKAKESIVYLKHGRRVKDAKLMVAYAYLQFSGKIISKSESNAISLAEQALDLNYPLAAVFLAMLYLMSCHYHEIIIDKFEQRLIILFSLLNRAIALEQEKEHLWKLESGEMDIYYPVTKVAKKSINALYMVWSSLYLETEATAAESFQNKHEKHLKEMITNITHLVQLNTFMVLNPAEPKCDHDEQIKTSNQLHQMALSTCANGALEKSLEIMQQAILMDPTMPAVWFDCAVIHMKLGQLTAALTQLKVARKLDPSSEVLFQIAHMHYQLGEYDSALSALEELYQLEHEFEGYHDLKQACELALNPVEHIAEEDVVPRAASYNFCRLL